MHSVDAQSAKMSLECVACGAFGSPQGQARAGGSSSFFIFNVLPVRLPYRTLSAGRGGAGPGRARVDLDVDPAPRVRSRLNRYPNVECRQTRLSWL